MITTGPVNSQFFPAPFVTNRKQVTLIRNLQISGEDGRNLNMKTFPCERKTSFLERPKLTKSVKDLFLEQS